MYSSFKLTKKAFQDTLLQIVLCFIIWHAVIYPGYFVLNCFIVDITCFYKGFHGDLNETLFVGDIDESSKVLVKTAYECMMTAIGESMYFNKLL